MLHFVVFSNVRQPLYNFQLLLWRVWKNSNPLALMPEISAAGYRQYVWQTAFYPYQ